MIACVANSSSRRAGQTAQTRTRPGWGCSSVSNVGPAKKKSNLPDALASCPLPMPPSGHAFIKTVPRKRAQAKQKLATAAAPAAAESERVEKRVENKNFYLNGKNQQMQRKTI